MATTTSNSPAWHCPVSTMTLRIVVPTRSLNHWCASDQLAPWEPQFDYSRQAEIRSGGMSSRGGRSFTTPQAKLPIDDELHENHVPPLSTENNSNLEVTCSIPDWWADMVFNIIDQSVQVFILLTYIEEQDRLTTTISSNGADD